MKQMHFYCLEYILSFFCIKSPNNSNSSFPGSATTRTVRRPTSGGSLDIHNDYVLPPPPRLRTRHTRLSRVSEVLGYMLIRLLLFCGSTPHTWIRDP